MRRLTILAALAAPACTTFVTPEGPPALVSARRLHAPATEGWAVHTLPGGGHPVAIRLDVDPMGLGFGNAGQGVSCDTPEEDPILVAARRRGHRRRRGCEPADMGYGSSGGAGVGGYGVGGMGTGGGGMGLGGGPREGEDPAAGLLVDKSEVQRTLDASPWGWAVVDLPYRGGAPARFPGRADVEVAEAQDTFHEHLSTFAVDVDTAAYSLTRRALVSGALPEPSLVRPEELLNAFRYRYPTPEGLFSIAVDGARSPFREDRYFMRVGIQARAVPEAERLPVNLVFLVDTSGSMSGSDRLDLVKDTLRVALDALDERDQVAITTYAGSVALVLPPTPATEKATFQAALDGLAAAGSTGMASGLDLAYQQAEAMHRPGTRTRVVVCSDGDANLGPSTPDALLDAIEGHARRGIGLTTVGFGTGNYKDAVMETLADKGDGAYAYVDSPRQARKVFGEDLGRMVQEVAKDVKIQVALSDRAVLAWRLVGYENRRLRPEDFEDDAVDAGEVGSGHQVTALYELALAPDAKGELGRVRVRGAPADGGPVVAIEAGVDVGTVARPWRRAQSDLRFAVAVVGLADVLRGSRFAEGWSLEAVRRVLAESAPEDDPDRAEVMALVLSAQTLEAGLALR
ncbi:MAG: von Willebrand factor type A domain-containing protein [Deltaproteobacteria bacterium]|nr:von Willebrand factor type A domain-containing protein [Deltaproteobacteria bacterium]